MVSNAVKEINNILTRLDVYAPSDFDALQSTFSPTKVYAVLAHWDYENNHVGEYAGISWIFRQWAALRKSNNDDDFIAKVSEWKICVLSFEPRKHIESREKIKMLLALENVKYLRTPPGQLKDIERKVEELSKVVVTGHERQGELDKLIGEMDSYELLNNYLHDFCKKDEFNKKDHILLKQFKNDIDYIRENLKEEDVPALNNFQARCNEPGSDAFKKECENLYQKAQKVVQEGEF